MIIIVCLSIILLFILTQVIIDIRKMQDQAHYMKMKRLHDAKNGQTKRNKTKLNK